MEKHPEISLGVFLLFHFLEDHAFTEGGVVFEDFNLPLHFLAVLAAPIGIVRLRRLEFYELVLRHARNLPHHP